MHDLERGANIGKVERGLALVKIAFETRRYLLMLVVTWSCFVLVVYGAHTRIWPSINNATLPTIFPPNLFESVEEPPHWVVTSLDAARRYEWVVANAEMASAHPVEPYVFVGRLRERELSLLQIKDLMNSVAVAEDVFCVAGPHLAVFKQLMLMNNELYVNPRMIGLDNNVMKPYEEESMFWPGEAVVKTRHLRVEIEATDLAGSTRQYVLEGIEAVCAQHVLDSFLNIPFLVASNDEL